MKIFTIIFGILMAICGVSCICTPLITFLEAGYFLVILLLAYGIMGIIKSVVDKDYGLSFLFSLLSIVLGVVIMVVPGLKLMTDSMLIYIMAFWFILQGVVSIFLAVRKKNAEEKGKSWIWMMILGVLGVLLGIYSLVHPMILAITFGILVGVYFIESGINMIVLAQGIQEEKE